MYSTFHLITMNHISRKNVNKKNCEWNKLWSKLSVIYMKWDHDEIVFGGYVMKPVKNNKMGQKKNIFNVICCDDIWRQVFKCDEMRSNIMNFDKMLWNPRKCEYTLKSRPFPSLLILKK